jgi:hypothetical protein
MNFATVDGCNALYHENIKVGTYIVSTPEADHTLVEIVFKWFGITT